MNNLDKHLYFINLLNNTHLGQQKALLNSASLQQISVICEILLNIINGVIEVDDDIKKYLNKKHLIIYELLNKKISKRRKKTIFKRNIALLKVILQSIIGFINNDPGSSKIYTNSRGEIQSNVSNDKNTDKQKL